MSHDPSEIILICWFAAQECLINYYQCWKQFCCAAYQKHMLMVHFVEANWNSKPVPLRFLNLILFVKRWFRCSVAEMESLTLLPLSPVHCVTVQVSAKPNYWSKTISNDPIPHSPIQNWETGLEILLQVKCVQEERWELFYHMSMFWNYFDCCCHSSSSRGKVWKTNGSWWVEWSSAVSEHQYAAIWAVHFLSRPKMTTCKVH